MNNETSCHAARPSLFLFFAAKHKKKEPIFNENHKMDPRFLP